MPKVEDRRALIKRKARTATGDSLASASTHAMIEREFSALRSLIGSTLAKPVARLVTVLTSVVDTQGDMTGTIRETVQGQASTAAQILRAIDRIPRDTIQPGEVVLRVVPQRDARGIVKHYDLIKPVKRD